MAVARKHGRRWIVGVLVASLCLPLVPAVPVSAAATIGSEPIPQAAAAATADDIVRIVFDGTSFAPFVTRVEPGTPLLFVNEGGAPITIQADHAAFTLSPIPPGGGAAITWPEAGSLTYRERITGANGRIVLGVTTFPGAAPDEPANASIPDAWPPPEAEDSFTVDPSVGVSYSTSRVAVTFSDTATVADAEGALRRAGLVIIGGSPTARVLYAAAPAAHASVRSAIAQLETEPAIAVVTRLTSDGLEALPPPVSDPSGVEWTGDPVLGEGRNWAQEGSGFPQLWNFSETLRRLDGARSRARAPGITTVVMDGGFDPNHPDLAALTVTEVCRQSLAGESVCTWTTPLIEAQEGNVVHGNNVSGIIGARQSGDGTGYDGGNPVAEMVGFSPGGVNWILLLDTLLDLKASGDSRFRDFRVMNISMSTGLPGAPDWAAAHPDFTCGPGPDDDLLPGTDLPCLPWTEDGNIAAALARGRQAIPVLQAAAAQGVMVVVAAANSANSFCSDGGVLRGAPKGKGCPGDPLTDAQLGIPSSAVSNPFAAASAQWLASDGPNPVYVVEALGDDGNVPSFNRASFSQTQGGISAPGYHVGPSWTYPDGEAKWAGQGGTSQATPVVTSVLSSMLALDPSMTVAELRGSVATFDDAADPLRHLDVAPRIDALGSMLAVEGGLLALLDVSDPSADGNRRVVYSPGGVIGSYDTETSTEAGFLTEPDGVVDLRDFRRVRDAWLQGCTSAGTPDCSVLTTVPVALDGGSDHPKRDLNFDGCVATDPPGETCPTAESIHPRFDFNGDGRLSRTATHPVNIDGGLEELTDLEVMARLFQPDPTGEGWNADTVDVPLLLEGLLVSGDVEVALGGLLGAGATDVAVTLRESDIDVFRRPLAASEESVVVTAHADRPVEIVVEGTKDGVPFEYRQSFDLDAGEDVRYDPCGVIRLEGSDSIVAFESTATVTATLVGCDAADVSGVDVDVIVTRATGGGDATVDSPVTTGAGGVATTTFTSGLNPGRYTVTATADLPTEAGSTITVESSLLIEVTEGYRYTTIAEQPDGTFGFPSLNDEGTVVFASRADANGPRSRINRYRDGALTEIGATVRDRTDAEIDINSIDITNDDGVLFQGDNFASGEPVADTHQWAGEVNVRFPTVVRIFGETSFFTPIDMSDQPAGNANGDRIMPIQRAGEVGTRVAAYLNGTLAEGPQLAADWVRHADNGYTIGRADLWPVDTNAGGTFFTSAIVIGDSNFGIGTDPDRAFLLPLAVENAPDATTPTEWTLLGDRPDISPSGDVVAFVGDRGDGPAVFVALRADDQGSFYPPVAVTGPGRSGPPELGFDGATPRHLEIDTAVNDHNEHVGVIHHPLGRDGLDDDIATVVVFGSPDGPGTPYTGGLYTIDIALTSTGAIAASGVHPVAEFGDTRLGATVERLGWHRVLADGGTSTDPSEHRLAFWVDTPAGERIVRADWVADDGGGGPVPLAGPLAGPLAERDASTAAPTALAAASPALVIPDPPGVPAVVVSDLTPEIGQVVTITNRSPQRRQFETYLLYEHDGTTRPMRADESQQLQFAAGDRTIEFTTEGVSTFVPFVVAPPPGIPPTADPGGPYDIESGDQLVLDASASADTDGTIVLYEWDLDGDGEFDDATGPLPRIDYPDVEDLLCNGLCSNPPGGGISYDPVHLRVTDDEGHTDVATGGVNVTVVVKDFTVSLLPATELVNPGGSTTLRVDVGSVGGFRDPVDLELISAVPEGYTITLSGSRVTPPASVNMIVRAPADAPEEAFDIQVRGTSGALAHETSAVAEAVFGLIPICYESLTGVVTDAVTGLPVPDLPIQLRGLGPTRYTTSGADGSYSYAGVQELLTFTVGAYPTDSYFRKERNGQIRCGDPLTVDLEVVPIQSTIVRGRVVEGIPDPTDTTRTRAIAATSTPVADPDVSVAGRYTAGDAAGRYGSAVQLLWPDNRGLNVSVSAAAPGFWPRPINNVRVEAGPAVTVDVPLVRACTTQVGAHGRVVDQDGNPMPGLTVRLGGSGGPNGFGNPLTRLLGTATTDVDGSYTIPPSETYLDIQNAAYRFEVSVSYGRTFLSRFEYAGCDSIHDAEVDIEVNVPDPTEPVLHYGSITGRVVDAVTGEPIENARVSGARTGPDGRFTKGNIYVGTDQYTVRTDLQVVVEPPYEYYREVLEGVTIAKDAVTDLGDIRVVPAEFVRIEGYVIDALTGAPLHRANVTVNPDFGTPNTFTLSTDENGYYLRERFKLPAYNEPRKATIEAVRTLSDGKYFRELAGTVPLNPGEATRTDFALTAICQNVTIRGYVVDAVTGLPIEGASVDTPVTSPVSTDEFGFYEFTGLSAGSYNQPGTYLLTASAPGYITQQKRVTVGCGSTVTVNFGADTGSGAVYGTVTDHLGNPVEGARVIAETGDSGTADAAGAYRIDDIPLGLDGQPTEWDVTAVHPDGRTIVLPATVTDGGETELNFVFPEPVDPPNVPPRAYDRSAFVIGGESVDITLVGTDADGDTLTFEVVSGPSIGSLTGVAPELTYLAPLDGDGDVTLTYTVSDGEDTSAPATVTITIEPPNRPPVANDLAVSVVTGESVGIVLTGSDADGDALTFEVVTQPAVGTLTGSAPNLTYEAPGDFTGEVTFTYTAFDGEDMSSSATVTITIEPPPSNTPPVAADLFEDVLAGDTIRIRLRGSDADGDPLTFDVVTQPAVGTLTGSAPDLTYEAPSDFVGEVTFTYTAFDGEDTSAPATVTIFVEERPAYAFLYGTVTDESGTPIEGAVVFSDLVPTPGFVEPDGTYFIPGIPVPSSGEPIEMPFTAWNPDGREITKPAILAADTDTELNFVFPSDGGERNTPPVADDVFVEVIAGESVAVTFSGSDADGDALFFQAVTQPSVGVLSGVAPDLVYLAASDFVGEVSFTYTAFDGVDVSSPATVTIDVLPPPNTPPSLANVDDVTMDEGASLQVAVSAVDAEDDPISLAAIGAPLWAGLDDHGDGSATITFEPTDDALTNVTVEACAGGQCSTTSFTVTVLNVDPALTIDAPASAEVGATVQVVGSADDPGTDELAYQVDCGGGFGALEPEPLFECTFDTVGPATVRMRVVDDDGGEDTAAAVVDVVTIPEILVTASNDGPAPWGTDMRLTATPETAGVSEPLVYRWDLDGDGAFDTEASPVPEVNASYPTPGERQAAVEVCGGDLCAMATTNVTIIRRPANIAAPDGGPVQYSDPIPVGTALTDPIDGEPIAGASVTITVAGTPTEVLTDGDGRASVTWLADVEAGAHPTLAEFAGDDLYTATQQPGSVHVVQEAALLAWVQQPVSTAASYDVVVDVVQDPDGSPGDIAHAFVTFWLDEGCDGGPVAAGTFPVSGAGGDAGVVTATIPGLAAAGCVLAELTDPEASTNRFFVAPTIEATVDDDRELSDGHVTGGGIFHTAAGPVSVGFVARARDGVLTGHVEVVAHGGPADPARSTVLTGLRIVEDDDGARTAIITGMALERTESGWRETKFTLIAVDGGRGRDLDSVEVIGHPVPCEGTFRGQVVVHR